MNFQFQKDFKLHYKEKFKEVEFYKMCDAYLNYLRKVPSYELGLLKPQKPQEFFKKEFNHDEMFVTFNEVHGTHLTQEVFIELIQNNPQFIEEIEKELWNEVSDDAKRNFSSLTKRAKNFIHQQEEIVKQKPSVE